MREWGTASAEAATAGAELICGLDTVEDRRSGNAKAGKNVGINERFIVLEPSGSAGGVEDSNYAPPWIYYPDRHATVREIEFDLVLETRSCFGRDYFNR
jgi:hypothetical protein